MKRTTLYMLIAVATAASALASAGPRQADDLRPDPARETVIEKNQAFPLIGPLIVTECLNEDCTRLRN